MNFAMWEDLLDQLSVDDMINMVNPVSYTHLIEDDTEEANFQAVYNGEGSITK